MIWLPIAFALLAGQAFAQVDPSLVKVGRKPSAVFQPTPGGYILRQPGPAHNISLTPRPVAPPSAGIKGVGAFSGGRQFRVNGNDFEMGGKYEMPIPKTSQKVPVTAISKVPKTPLAKALLKTLPFVGNAAAFAELLEEMKNYWDQSSPNKPGEETEIEKGQVQRFTEAYKYCVSDKCASKPVDACKAYYLTPYAISIGLQVYASDQNGYLACFYVGSSNALSKIDEFSLGKQKQPIPDEILEEFAEEMPDSDVGQLLDQLQDNDHFTPDLPADLPTEASGPSSAPGRTTTTTRPDGSTTTTTSSTTISYDENNINITNNTTTVTRGPNGEVTDTSTTTESGDTPEKPQEEPTDLCKDHPDILACKKLEEPEAADIPKRSEEISLQQGSTFSGGGCVPDLVVQVFGRSVTVLSMATPCGWITSYMRPLILLLAAMSAVFIIYPKGD